MTASPSDALPRRVSTSYAVGAVGTGVFATVPGLLLLYYLTDVLGVAAGVASLVLFVPKAWDAVLNPVVGTMSDRTTGRWGRRRPYLLAGALAVPVFFALLFSAPRLGSTWLTALYVGVVYTLAMTAYALFQVPWVAMPAEITGDYHERTALMSKRMVLLTVGILLGGALAPAISGGKTGGRSGYTTMSLVVAVILAVALLTAWRGTRGVREGRPQRGARPSVRRQAAIITGNRPFLALFAGYAVQSVAVGAMLAGAPYVATYVLDDSGLAAVLFVFLVGPAALVMPLWRRASLRHGKLACYLAASALFGLTALSLVLARHEPQAAVFTQMGLLGCGYAGMQLFPYSMLPDAIAADEVRSGEARAGVYTGVWQAGETVGLAVGPAIYALVLAVTGFVSSAADVRVSQPGSALTGLVAGFSVLPAVLLLASLPLLRGYAPADTRPALVLQETS